MIDCNFSVQIKYKQCSFCMALFSNDLIKGSRHTQARTH